MAARQTEPYLSAYLHSRGGALGLPIAGNFELTARCNFHCPMCYVHLDQADTAGKELTARQWIDLARQARDAGMVFALLTGGEPFVRKDFFKIYNEMKAMGLMLSINSNGSMLYGDIRRQLLDNPPQRMNISLYGGCRETYQAMCGRDSFDTVLENIRALKEAGVEVRLNLSITPYNRQDLEKIYGIAQTLAVPVKASAYMYPAVRIPDRADHRLSAQEAALCSVEWDRLRFSVEEFAQRASRMQELSAEDERNCAVEMEEGVGCRAGYTSFWLTWDGKMRPCGMMPGPETNPLETGFSQAWQQLRQATRQIPGCSDCAKCEKREICAVCAAVRVAETGAFDQVPEYMCRMTEQILAATGQTQWEGKKNAD